MDSQINASGSLASAVLNALTDLQLKKSDTATAVLAVQYAKRIDDGEPIEKVGPLLLASLEALHMTPRSRATLTKGGSGAGIQPSDPLDELLERRRSRAANATSSASAAGI